LVDPLGAVVFAFVVWLAVFTVVLVLLNK